METKRRIGLISREVFQVFLVTYLVLLILETIRPGLVSYFFDINYCIPIIVLSGILMSLWSVPEKVERKKKFSELDIYFMFLVVLGSGLLVFFKTMALGWIAYLIAGVCAVLVALISLYVFFGES